jgi:hypothetical protein
MPTTKHSALKGRPKRMKHTLLAQQQIETFNLNQYTSQVTPQHNLRWHHQKAGLSCFGSVGCLTELGIVHQGVAHQ